MTDDERLPDPLAAVRALPKGAGVIIRARTAKKRESLTRDILALARNKELVLLIAGDPVLALALGADGVHLAETDIAQGPRIRSAGHLLITAASHSPAALLRAKISGADAALLSPVFPTRSHKGANTLTPVRAAFIARSIDFPVYALGGVDATNAMRLSGFSGIAAIGSLKV